MHKEFGPDGGQGISISNFSEQIMLQGLFLKRSHTRFPTSSSPEDQRLARVRHHRFHVLDPSIEAGETYTFWDNEHKDMTILLEELEAELNEVLAEIALGQFDDEDSRRGALNHADELEAALNSARA